MHLRNFVKKVIVHFGKNLLVFIIEKKEKLASPGVAGWRLKPARKGSGRPGWEGIKRRYPLKAGLTM